MSILQVDVGVFPNDKSGDPIRFAFQKTNSNATELNSRLASLEDTFGPFTISADQELTEDSDLVLVTQKAIRAFITQLFSANDTAVLKGVVDCSVDPNYPAADAGWTYRVSGVGHIGGASGQEVSTGDILLCVADGTPAGNQATVGAYWSVLRINASGTVIGPNSATDNAIVVFNGTSGKIIKSATLTTLIDAAFGNTRGSLLTRTASGWGLLAPGPSGQAIISAGAAADLTWGSISTASGDVTGPSESTADAIALFHSTSGKLLKDSGKVLSTDATFASDSDDKFPSEKAIKTYVDAVPDEITLSYSMSLAIGASAIVEATIPSKRLYIVSVITDIVESSIYVEMLGQATTDVQYDAAFTPSITQDLSQACRFRDRTGTNKLRLRVTNTGTSYLNPFNIFIKAEPF